MMDLRTYIDNLEVIDGHIHGFSHDAQIELPKKCVFFADIVLNEPDKYSSTYLKSLYKNFDHTPSQLPLATGLDLKTIDTVFRAVKCYGFGELKLYDNYEGEKINRKDPGFAHKVCNYSRQHENLPVYIHYTIENEQNIKDIREVLRTQNDINIILCHCGADHRILDPKYSIDNALKLQKEYPNLWLDISYSAFDYFSKYPELLETIPDKMRCFIGSDANPAEKIHNIPNNFKRDANKLLVHIPSNENLRRLFNSDF